MRFSIGQTVYSGGLAGFPEVATELSRYYPCAARLMTALDRKQDLIRKVHWMDHVLRQCTFSYLRQDYVASTVCRILGELPQHSILDDLRKHASDLKCGRVSITNDSMAALNKVAALALMAIDANKIKLLEDAMDNIGRYLFAAGNRDVDRSRPLTWFNWACLVSMSHVSTEDVVLEWQKAIANVSSTADQKTLKTHTLLAMTILKKELATAEPTVTVFRCGDIKLNGETFTIGGVLFVDSKRLTTFQGYSSAPAYAKSKLANWLTNSPHEAFAVVHATGHPKMLSSALYHAREQLDLVLGYLSSCQTTFSPAPEYDFLIWAINNPRLIRFDHAKVSPCNSLLLIRHGDGKVIQDNFQQYIAPNLDLARPLVLRTKAERVLRTLRKAAFHAGCREHTEALGALWRACESLFAATGEQERGVSVARRLAVFVVLPTGDRTDVTREFTDSDLLEFANDIATGIVTPVMHPDTISVLLQIAVDSDDVLRSMARFLLIRDAGDEALQWLERRVSARLKLGTPNRTASNKAIDDVRHIVSTCYRLRNDLSHDAYAHDAAARVVYEQLREMLVGNLINIMHNLSIHASHEAFLKSLDDHYELLTVGASEELIRVRAHELWEARGRPMDDPWADWFTARARLGLAD